MSFRTIALYVIFFSAIFALAFIYFPNNLHYIDHAGTFDLDILWQKYGHIYNFNNLGGSNVIPMYGLLPHLIFNKVLNLLSINSNYWGKISLALSISFLFISISSLSYILLSRKLRFRSILSLLLGLLVIISNWFLIHISYGWILVTFLPISFLILSTLFYYKYLITRNKSYFLISLILEIPTVIVVHYYLICLLIKFVLSLKLNNLKIIVVTILLSLLINISFLGNYLVSTIYSGKNYYSQDNYNSTINFLTRVDITQKTFDIISQDSRGLNSSYANLLHNNYRKLFTLLFTFSPIVICELIITKKSKSILPKMGLLAVITFFGIVGSNIGIWFLRNIPLLMMFRDYTKVLPLIYLFSLYYWIKLINYKTKSLLIILPIAIGLFFTSISSYTSKFGQLTTSVEPPDSYLSIPENRKGYSLILPAPIWFTRIRSSDVSQMINPLNYTLADKVIYSETGVRELGNIEDIYSYFQNKSTNIKNDDIEAILNRFGVNRLIVQKDRRDSLMYEWDSNIDAIRYIENKIPMSFSKTYSSNDIDVYENPSNGILYINDFPSTIRLDGSNLMITNQEQKGTVKFIQNSNPGWAAYPSKCIHKTTSNDGRHILWQFDFDKCQETNTNITLIYQPEIIYRYLMYANLSILLIILVALLLNETKRFRYHLLP